jgi:hypothetical protein
MTQAQHTPGPWSANVSDDDLVFAANGLHIATVGNEYQEQSGEEITANARLIAQSPALYAFAAMIARMTPDGEEIDGKEFVMENDDAVSTVNDLIDAARNLIAKTKREQP